MKTLAELLAESKVDLETVDLKKALKTITDLLKSHDFTFAGRSVELRHVFGGSELVFSFTKPRIDDVLLHKLVYIYSQDGKLSVDAQIKPRKYLVGNNATQMKPELLYKQKPLDTLVAKHVEIIRDNL